MSWPPDENDQISRFDVFCDFTDIRIVTSPDHPLNISTPRSKTAIWNSKDDKYAFSGQIAWIVPGAVVVTNQHEGTWINNEHDVDVELGSRVTAFGRRDPETREVNLNVLREVGKDILVRSNKVAIDQLLANKDKIELGRVRVRGELVSSEWLNQAIYKFQMRSGRHRFEIWVPAKSAEIKSLDLITATELSSAGVVSFYPQDDEHDFRIFAGDFEDLAVEKRNVLWTSRTVGLMALGVAGVLVGLLGWSSRLRTRVSEGEKQVRKITAKLNHACESVREGMVVVGKDNHVQFANKQATTTLGIDVKNGMSSAKLLRKLKRGYESVSPGFEVCWQTLNANENLTQELQLELTDRDQSKRLLEVFSSPVTNDDGEYVNRLWTFHDVTEKEQLHQSLAHLQKQEAIGQLASGFAHDFNNLLQGIIGHLSVIELAKNRRVGEMHDCLEAAIGASERASSLVGRILSFSRKSQLQFESCDVNKILERMDRLLQPSIHPATEVEYRLGKELPPILADSTQIEQVFLNLCLNARDSIDNGGRILVCTSASDGFCIISVSDNGPGIPEEVQEHIFEPFFTTRPGEGSGLGLSMCEGIVHQHGGRIEFDSSKNNGTEFRVYLPVSGSNLESTPDTATNLELTGKVGLVVDDEEVIRTSIAALLTHFGATVMTAANGSEALTVLSEFQQADLTKAQPVDFILLDWTMPVMDGKETLQDIKSRYPDLPIVVCSGYTFDCEAVSAKIGVRPDAVLQKPYRPEKICQVLGEVLFQNKKNHSHTKAV